MRAGKEKNDSKNDQTNRVTLGPLGPGPSLPLGPTSALPPGPPSSCPPPWALPGPPWALPKPPVQYIHTGKHKTSIHTYIQTYKTVSVSS